MAAGIGSRFKAGVKQLAGVGPHGERLMDYAIFDARRAGFGKIIFIVRDEHQDEFRALAAHMKLGADAVIVVQRLEDVPPDVPQRGRTKPWGTGQAVLATRGHVDGPFVVINADDFYGREAYEAAVHAAADAARGITTVIGMRLEPSLSPNGAVTRGVCDTEGVRVTRIDEVQELTKHDGRITGASDGRTREFTGHEVVSMNFWVFPPDTIDHLDRHFHRFLKHHAHDHSAEFRLPDVVNALITEGHAEVRATDRLRHWFGLTFAADREDVVKDLAGLAARGVYPSPLWP